MSGSLISSNGTQEVTKLCKGGLLSLCIAGTWDGAVVNVYFQPSTNSPWLILGKRATDINKDSSFIFHSPFNAKLRTVTTNAGISTYLVCNIISTTGSQ